MVCAGKKGEVEGLWEARAVHYPLHLDLHLPPSVIPFLDIFFNLRVKTLVSEVLYRGHPLKVVLSYGRVDLKVHIGYVHEEGRRLVWGVVVEVFGAVGRRMEGELEMVARVHELV